MGTALHTLRSLLAEPGGRVADARLVGRMLHTSQVCALLVAAMGALALIGWQADIGPFKRVRPDLGTMASGTAVALVLSGVALWLLHPRHDGSRWGWFARVLPWGVLALSGLTLAEYLLHVDLGIDELFFADPDREVQSEHPGRMSMVAALGFALLGSALLLIRLASRSAQRLARMMVLATSMMLLVGLLGLLYGPASLYAIPVFHGVAVQTIAALLMLATGILAIQPARGFTTLLASAGAGGRLSRRLLPFAFVAPLALGWLRLQGERAGLYQIGLGVDLMVVALVALFVAVIWWQARLLDIADTERRQAEQALRESEAAVRALSLTDALTGLANRRRLDEGLRGEVQRVQRYGGRLSAVIADLDHFKAINDEHGHQAGDELLHTFAQRIRVHCREMDLVARFGGEEFVILMPEVGATEAQACAERIRTALAQETIPPLTRPVTASFGVAELMPGESAASLLRRADKALYQGKAAGRNCVVAALGKPAHRGRPAGRPA